MWSPDEAAAALADGADEKPVGEATPSACRRYVETISGGRLGYAHMNDMSEGALRRLYMDLDADNRTKDGIVIDVRNNNGGFVNVYAIDVLARRGYMNMTPRRLPAAPARTMLGQRALERQMIRVTNQHSLSEAEDFTEGSSFGKSSASRRQAGSSSPAASR